MSRPKGSKNKAKDSGGDVQTAVNTLLSTGLIKPKAAPETDRLEDLLDWGPKIEAFCEKKGFPPSELIEKFEGLEKDKTFLGIQLGEMIAQASHITLKKDMTPFEILSEFGPEAYERALNMLKGQKQAHSSENSGIFHPDSPYGPEECQNKPLPAPQIEKGLLGLLKDDPAEKGLKSAPSDPAAKPKELSSFMKARQKLKNGTKDV